jgi:hypothetical protein
MREKILKYMQLSGFNLNKITDELVDKMVGGLKREFEEGFGESLPEKCREALVVFEKALRDRQMNFQNDVVTIYEGYFTDEATIDAIVAFYESPAGQAIVNANMTALSKVMDAQQAWHDNTVKEIETEFSRILGDNSVSGLNPEALNKALEDRPAEPTT